MNEAQLVKAIRTLIEKGDHAAGKAEQFFVAAGQHLKTLKQEHAGNWAQWERLLKTKCNLSTGRASELMQIADGRKTVAEVREGKAESMRRVRDRSSPRGEESEPDEDQKVVEFWDPEKEGHPYPPNMRRQGLLNRADEAVRLAKFDDFAGLEVDEDMRKAVQRAVNAWNETLTKLEKSREETEAA